MRELSSKSLLRYPGGKSRAVQQIIEYFPKDITEMVSPFFGGGSIELYMASKGVRVYGYDAFVPLVEFWQCVLQHPRRLASLIKRYYPLSKKKFYHLQRQQLHYKNKLHRAAVFYVLNRCSFSGSTLSGGMSPQHPRFTLSAINRVAEFYNPHVSAKRLNFRKSIAKHPNAFLYLDPPYYIKNKLYGVKGNLHKGFDHEGLCKLLQKRGNWVLSYNNCIEVRRMYKRYRMISLQWKYGMSQHKASNELLILSNDLATSQ